LADVGLDADEFAERSPFTLSGGEARRVAIAGVLAMRPAYVLLDEPTAGLDASGRGTITSLIASLGTRAGVVVVTHDPDAFVGLADRFVVLEEGRAGFDGPAAAYCADAVSLAERGVPLPEVIRAQVLASRHAALGGPVTIDVRRAARMLARMAGVTS
jgi:energy-coupling factor transport system ATP-binding protein